MMSLVQAIEVYKRRHSAEPVPGESGCYRCPNCGYELTFGSRAAYDDWHNVEPIEEGHAPANTTASP